MAKKIEVKGSEITVISKHGQDYISLTDMLKAKDGDFFISDWLRNRNTLEFLGIWETVYNPDFNYGEFAIIKVHRTSLWVKRLARAKETSQLEDHCRANALDFIDNTMG